MVTQSLAYRIFTDASVVKFQKYKQLPQPIHRQLDIHLLCTHRPREEWDEIRSSGDPRLSEVLQNGGLHSSKPTTTSL